MTKPPSHIDPRDWEMCRRHEAGESFADIGRAFGRTGARVGQIVKAVQRRTTAECDVCGRTYVYHRPETPEQSCMVVGCTGTIRRSLSGPRGEGA